MRFTTTNLVTAEPWIKVPLPAGSRVAAVEGRGEKILLTTEGDDEAPVIDTALLIAPAGEPLDYDDMDLVATFTLVEEETGHRHRFCAYEAPELDERSGLLRPGPFYRRAAAVPPRAAAAALVFDIDGLGRINSQQGIGAAAAVIVRMAGVLREFAAANDGAVAGLIGSQEFGLLVPGMGQPEGEALAAPLQAAMAHDVGGDPATSSVGVAASGAGRTPLGAIARARELCRQAKTMRPQPSRAGDGLSRADRP